MPGDERIPADTDHPYWICPICGVRKYDQISSHCGACDAHLKWLQDNRCNTRLRKMIKEIFKPMQTVELPKPPRPSPALCWNGEEPGCPYCVKHYFSKHDIPRYECRVAEAWLEDIERCPCDYL